MKYLIANWKANKNIDAARQWMAEFNHLAAGTGRIKTAIDSRQLALIVCPPANLLHPLIELDQTGLEFGSQDISMFENGLHTGEITAATLAGMASWSIIGHSERRREYGEDGAKTKQKLAQANKYGIKTILCFSSIGELEEADILCFEPPSAISNGDGMGQIADAQDIAAIKKELGEVNGKFIYGGSVNENNIAEYAGNGLVDGFLAGGASLDPRRFFSMAEKMLY